MPGLRVRQVGPDDRGWVAQFITDRWGADRMVAHGAVYRPAELPGFMAVEDGERVGLLSYQVEGPACEIVSLDSTRPSRGVGNALIEAVKEAARRSGCSRVWLVTTNDNLNALRFYQKRGFALVAVHRNALETSRRLKPEIPLIGTDGIPLRDELELELVLQEESGKASMPGGASKILLLGEPGLRIVCAAVTDVMDPAFVEEMRDLQDALRTFRTSHGFGRAIAAPQIGIPKRLVAIEIGRGPSVLINPEITWKSEETFTMWDDCMCFPFLLVRVRRHGSISIAYTDARGSRREWNRLDQATSELLQHELDHLDGVLAVDKAVDRDSLISRAAFEAAPDVFRARVDYVIASD